MKRFYIMQGCPGSGKSTVAELIAHGIMTDVMSHGSVQVFSTDNLFLDASGKYNFDKTKLSEYHDKNYEMVVEAMTIGIDNVILDNTNIQLKFVQRYIDAANTLGYTVQVIRVTAPFEEAAKRNVHNVPKSAVKHMYKSMEDLVNPSLAPTWKVPLKVEREYVDQTLPLAVICDLDGTLAIMGDRSPFDASYCDRVDTINHPVAMTLKALSDANIRVIFLSGRENKPADRVATVRFLESVSDQYGFIYDRLIMRELDDHRPDAIIKMELYDKYIKPNWNVLYCLDDRDQVVDAFRERGIPVFQVQYGGF